MATEHFPDNQALKEAFGHEIYSSSGNPLRFGSLFYDCDVYPAEKRVLLIFIRHFFCGNCQEYVRRLSSTESPFHPSHISTSSTTCTTNFSKPASRTLPTVIIIGPGQPSLISTYKTLTQCPFDIYADPSTHLYSILGMHRTLSMGSKAPEYIEHSLVSGAVKSAWQIVRRVGSGDATRGGDWDVNGGEFLLMRSSTSSRSDSHSPSRSRSRSRSTNRRASQWQVSWCHRMLNSRDHTELVDLAYRTCFTAKPSSTSLPDSPTNSPAPPLKSILVNGGKVHSRTISRSYSSERLGSCPAPEIPKSRAEVLVSQHQNRSQSKSKSPHQPRSRSTSVGSRTTAKQNHDRIWSSVSNSDVLRSESRASTTATRESTVVSPISEGEEKEVKPRKSFTASVAERLGVRNALLRRSRSVSAPPPAAERAPSLPQPSTSLPELRTFSETSTDTTEPKSKSITGPLALLRTKSKTKQPPTEDTAAQENLSPRPGTPPKTQARSRTFSFSKTTPKHRPSLSLTRKPSGSVEMDENGVMFVDGVEFVNVISVKARVDTDGDRERESLRQRADSGLGMEIEAQDVGQTRPPIPGKKKYSVVTALPEVVASR